MRPVVNFCGSGDKDDPRPLGGRNRHRVDDLHAHRGRRRRIELLTRRVEVTLYGGKGLFVDKVRRDLIQPGLSIADVCHHRLDAAPVVGKVDEGARLYGRVSGGELERKGRTACPVFLHALLCDCNRRTIVQNETCVQAYLIDTVRDCFGIGGTTVLIAAVFRDIGELDRFRQVNVRRSHSGHCGFFALVFLCAEIVSINGDSFPRAASAENNIPVVRKSIERKYGLQCLDLTAKGLVPRNGKALDLHIIHAFHTDFLYREPRRPCHIPNDVLDLVLREFHFKRERRDTVAEFADIQIFHDDIGNPPIGGDVALSLNAHHKRIRLLHLIPEIERVVNRNICPMYLDFNTICPRPQNALDRTRTDRRCKGYGIAVGRCCNAAATASAAALSTSAKTLRTRMDVLGEFRPPDDIARHTRPAVARDDRRPHARGLHLEIALFADFLMSVDFCGKKPLIEHTANKSRNTQPERICTKTARDCGQRNRRHYSASG